jgi:hypothetical protein
VLADPGGLARLQRLGPKKVPVLARGARFIFPQSLEDVAEFVGLADTGLTRLPPEALVAKWLVVLRTAQGYSRQFTPERFEEDAVASRPRPVRVLAHHVFRVAESFLETAVDGHEYSIGAANQESPVRLDREGVARYGAGVIARVEAWWGALGGAGKAGRDCQAPLPTYYGPQSTHQLLERCAWHSAQHVRQLAAVLEAAGATPEPRLQPETLAGLPLPQGIWG